MRVNMITSKTNRKLRKAFNIRMIMVIAAPCASTGTVRTDPDRESGCAILLLDQKVLKTVAIHKKMQAQIGSTHGFYRSNLKFYEIAQPVRW